MVFHSLEARPTRRNSAAGYVRHRPETTLLYQVVEEYWPEFQAELASQGKYLPTFICREFDEYLKCGRLRGHLESQDKPIGPNDMLIAAHALTLDCTVVTGNDREVSRVPGLKVENWLTSPE